MRNGMIVLAALNLLFGSLSRGFATIEGVETATVGFVGMATDGDLDKPALIQSWNEFAETFGGYDPGLANPSLAPSVAAFFQNGGRRCYVVRVGSHTDSAYIGVDDVSAERRTGLETLRYVDEVSIVCVPGVASSDVQRAMIAHCEDLKDRVCILDPAKTAGMGPVRSQRQNVGSNQGYAALYFPWVEMSLPDISLPILIPPSGAVAGVYARTDSQRGVWKAPADEIVAAVGVAVDLSSDERDILNSEGINVIRLIANQGVQIWGARTTTTDPEWRYVNIRRFFIFLEESIHEGTEWAVFENNDESLWTRLKETVSEFLQEVWRDGGLQGATPEEAYFVRVDRTTMTQDDLDRGRTILQIGAAAVRPAAFITFRVVHERTGIASIPAMSLAGLAVLLALLVLVGIQARRRFRSCSDTSG